MVSEISSFAITGYHDPAAPPTVAGSIVGMLYWYEGLAGWASLPETPPTVPLGIALHLAPQWLNQGAEPISGHIELTITKPDGTKVTLNDVLNQNNWATPGNVGGVQFESVTLDQAGTYKAETRLTTMDQTLAEQIEDVVIIAPLAVAQFYVPPEMRKKLTDGTIAGMYWNCEVWCDITNNGDAPGTHNVHIWDSIVNVDFTMEVTLQPGETCTWHRSQWIDFKRISRYSVWAQGDWEENNYSVASFP